RAHIVADERVPRRPPRGQPPPSAARLTSRCKRVKLAGRVRVSAVQRRPPRRGLRVLPCDLRVPALRFESSTLRRDCETFYRRGHRVPRPYPAAQRAGADAHAPRLFVVGAETPRHFPVAAVAPRRDALQRAAPRTRRAVERPDALPIPLRSALE